MNKRFKPQYLPYNNDAHALVEALAMELGLSSCHVGRATDLAGLKLR